jgi:hypothetical protein
MKMRAIFNPCRAGKKLLDALTVIAFTVMCAVSLQKAVAQNNDAASTNRTEDGASLAPKDSPTAAEQARAFEQATEKIRADCIQGRRIICGRIVKILPDGLVVDSGYTNLMRAPLNKSWLVPGTAQATREANMIEANEPGCACVGLVFLTALPKSRSAAKPHPYDFVVVQAYPAGQYTYTSVGTIQRTVRRFSGVLATAVKINRAAAGIQPPVFVPDAK